jgi:hypothetical protein
LAGDLLRKLTLRKTEIRPDRNTALDPQLKEGRISANLVALSEIISARIDRPDAINFTDAKASEVFLCVDEI